MIGDPDPHRAAYNVHHDIASQAPFATPCPPHRPRRPFVRRAIPTAEFQALLKGLSARSAWTTASDAP